MSDQGAGGQPIKSCQMRKQVGARWTAAGHRESEMASRAVSGYLLCAVALVFLMLLQGTQSVYIQYQGFQVQLESVKQLNDLVGQWVPSPGLQDQSPQPSVCHHPALPLDLRPICASKDVASIFQALRTIANDDCELCVNVACTGCS
uniref:Guanylate cyclase activator 2B n=5 Tax=Bovinae TaxID=27592 RepID=E1BIM1_BOVIN